MSDSADPSAFPDLPQRVPVRRTYPMLRTIAALILRECTTRFARKPGGLLWVIFQPLLMIIVLAMAFELLARTPGAGTSFLLFKATGLLVLQMARQTAQDIGRSLNFSRALLMYPGVVWMDAILARFLLNGTLAILTTALIITGIVIYEDLTLIIDWGPIAQSIALALLFALSWGCLNAFLMERFDVWTIIWSVLNGPLVLVSGVVLLYENMPTFAQDILWYNPLLHITGLMREGVYSTYQPQYISIPYVLTCCLIPLVFGLLLLRRYHRELLAR